MVITGCFAVVDLKGKGMEILLFGEGFGLGANLDGEVEAARGDIGHGQGVEDARILAVGEVDGLKCIVDGRGGIENR